MNHKSRFQLLPLVVLLVAAVSVQAADVPSKRRSVTPRSPGPLVTAAVTGTITDAVTGLPIVNAHVSGGRRGDQTDTEGKFEIKAAEGYGEILFEAERSGYQMFRQKLSGTGPHVLTIQLQPTPTVTVRKTDGSTMQVDYESLKFGYGVPFSGYRNSESESFCFPNGTSLDVHRSQMRKITGPGTFAASGCCTTRNALKVTLEQKDGQISEVYFVDSCATEYKQELVATNHVSGVTVYIGFEEIAEIVFP